MLQFLNVFDRETAAKASRENEHVTEVKEQLRPYIDAARAKLPGLKAAWAERNTLLAEIIAHHYPYGLPVTCDSYLTNLNMLDPIEIVNRTIEQWESICYADICDGTGLDRWPVDPVRRSGVISGIIATLGAANLEDHIRRNVAAVKEKLQEAAEQILRDGPPAPPMDIPAMPEPPERIIVRTKYSQLQR